MTFLGANCQKNDHLGSFVFYKCFLPSPEPLHVILQTCRFSSHVSLVTCYLRRGKERDSQRTGLQRKPKRVQKTGLGAGGRGGAFKLLRRTWSYLPQWRRETAGRPCQHPHHWQGLGFPCSRYHHFNRCIRTLGVCI